MGILNSCGVKWGVKMGMIGERERENGDD